MALSDSFVKKVTPEENKAGLEGERARAYLQEAGLEGADVDYLRKTQLPVQEAVVAKQEQLDNAIAKRGHRQDWEEFLDAKRRMGRVLHHTEFIRLLRLAMPTLVVARGAQLNRISLYCVRNTPVKEIARCKVCRTHFDAPWYIGFIEEGEMPEYEIDLPNEKLVAVAQRRGWRTILVRLQARLNAVSKRPDPLVNERKILEVFGLPTNGHTASWYRQRLWQFRHGIFTKNQNFE